MKNIVIIGGVSCDPNDNEHDANPYNFINPGVGLAKRLGNAIVLIHAKSYEIRAKKYPPDKEHRWVAKTVEERKKLKPDHFLKTVQSHAKDVREVATANDVNKILNGLQIHTISYFGHSNKADIFLEYNTDGRGKGMVTWGVAEAKRIDSSAFNTATFRGITPIFASFGCYQGEEKGLCDKLQHEWMVQTFGARGKTNYKTIGELKKYPSGAYFMYPLPTAVDGNMQFGAAAASTPEKLY